MPHWLRAAIALEVVGAVAVVLLLIRVGGDGAQAVGDAIQWVKPRVVTESPSAVVPVLPPRPGTTADPVARRQLDQLGVLGGPLLGRLDRDAATTAAGELRLITVLEQVIRDRIVHALDGAAGR